MKRRRVVIKGSSLPVLRIVVRDGDVQALRGEIGDTIENARPLLAEAIAVLDLREREAGDAGVRELVDAVRDANIRLAAVLIGERSGLASIADLGLPLIEAPLSTRERPGGSAIAGPVAAGPAATTAVEPSNEQGVDATSQEQAAEQATAAGLAPLYLTRPLRSGQRVYAQGRDAVVAAPTSRGSELIADGSIYAFSPVRGRVLAGAAGNAGACIVATHLDAELVAIAGVYRIFEADELKALGSGPVSVALSRAADGSERLTLAALPSSSSMQNR